MSNLFVRNTHSVGRAKGLEAATVDRLTKRIKRLPQALLCHLMAGDCNSLLRIVASDLDAYRQFQIDHLTRLEGVQSVKTEIPMQRVKLSLELPLRKETSGCAPSDDANTSIERRNL